MTEYINQAPPDKVLKYVYAHHLSWSRADPWCLVSKYPWGVSRDGHVALTACEFRKPWRFATLDDRLNSTLHITYCKPVYYRKTYKWLRFPNIWYRFLTYWAGRCDLCYKHYWFYTVERGLYREYLRRSPEGCVRTER